MNIPIIMNGIPIPAEYASSRLNASPGVVAASVSIEPKIGPTHGVHPAAKARPNTNERGKLATELEGNTFFSKFNFEIFVLNIIKIPNAMMIIPPIWLKFEMNSFANGPKTELIPTPIVENTTENPRTKNII